MSLDNTDKNKEDEPIPRILVWFINRKRVWFIVAIFFAVVAVYIAMEQKQCAINYNELASMYNACKNPIFIP